MTHILTITLNPALDVSASTHDVRHTSKLRCDAVERHPGGGGINVARVLHRLGVDCTALSLLGGPTGAMVALLLADEGVACDVLNFDGHTRESFTVQDLAAKQEYRFVLPGPVVTEQSWQALLDKLSDYRTAKFAVLSGSLPPGLPQDAYAHMTMLLKSTGTKICIDSSGPPMLAALQAGVYMAKPSLREMRELTGQPLSTPQEIWQAALVWIRAGYAEVVLVSLGADGALMATADGLWRAPPVPCEVVSAVGAGDSFVAGFVWAASRGLDLQKSFQCAVASGTAAVASNGTGLCEAAEVQALVPKVQIECLSLRYASVA